MAIFRSKFAEDAETIRGKLDKAQARVRGLEADLKAKAYDAALADNPDVALAPIRDQLVVARLTVEALGHAVAEASRLEAARLEKARLAARKSELRAFAQHAGALQRAVESYQRTAAELQGCWEAIVDAAERARRLLPPDAYRTYPELFPRKLADRGEVELARLGRRGDEWALPGENAPGSRAGFLGGRMPTEQSTFSDGMREVLAFYSTQFKAHLSLPVTSSLPSEPVESAAEPEPPGIDPGMAEPADVAIGAAPVPMAPHPEGSVEAAEYEAALAALAGRLRPAEPVMEMIDV